MTLSSIFTAVLLLCCCYSICALADPTDPAWAWLSGSKASGVHKGEYGIKNVANVTNMPGARVDAVGWFDSTAKELWLFGGYGFDSAGNMGALFSTFCLY